MHKLQPFLQVVHLNQNIKFVYESKFFGDF
jgi:hypothetical protein